MMANVSGQIKVVGHITAAVTESGHASSAVVTSFALKNQLGSEESISQAVNYWSSETLNLGAITINAGVNMVYTIKLRDATLSDRNGNFFTIEPTLLISGNDDTLRADGSQILCLMGTARLTPGLAFGRYEGSYSLVVVYN